MPCPGGAQRPAAAMGALDAVPGRDHALLLPTGAAIGRRPVAAGGDRGACRGRIEARGCSRGWRRRSPPSWSSLLRPDPRFLLIWRPLCPPVPRDGHRSRRHRGQAIGSRTELCPTGDPRHTVATLAGRDDGRAAPGQIAASSASRRRARAGTGRRDGARRRTEGGPPSQRRRHRTHSNRPAVLKISV